MRQQLLELQKKIDEIVVKLVDGTDKEDTDYVKYKKRQILLNYTIDDNIVERCIYPLMEMDKDGSNLPIELLLNTRGGYLDDGLVLCDIIDNSVSPIIITALGQASSLGILILAAGYRKPNVTKRCYSFTTGLIHEGESGVRGSPSQCQDILDFQRKYYLRIKQYVCSHSKITPELYEKNKKNEWYLSSNDLLKFGFVNYIIGKTKPQHRKEKET